PKPKPKQEAEKKWVPPSERRRITMDQLPAECRMVIDSPGVTPVAADAVATGATGATPAAPVKK
ncbi:MAG TPA: penicillin-insensitive murein endopeptidase, partial [Hyphomicrobium sp.]|nr:penicillin-insensitive murein endopeptidase [Hyphomicrobium sp.]